MAQLGNKTTTNRFLVQQPSYIIKTRAIAVFFRIKKLKLLAPFLAKNGKIQTFSTVRKSLNTHGTFQFICSIDL